ncbi:MAG TPA: putative Fe-S cluster assembly protein SufT [Candidatus Sulfotelmatobacter sp.]|nr:putative Fe-S cluster assembly protein SufT [Candidatus Sulfotelmatobacter sp.]
MYEQIDLKRECEAIEIPSGIRRVLSAGSRVRISQFLGTSYTVVSDMGCMFRIDAKDADALGLTPPTASETKPSDGIFSEKLVWDQLKTVYDPEIPVNIVDLGLIYSCEIAALEQGGKKIDVKMSMTAPGCGMGNVLKADVEGKLSRLPEVKEVNVQVVFEPTWSPALMSEAAKLQLGFDLDYGKPSVTGISQ